MSKNLKGFRTSIAKTIMLSKDQEKSFLFDGALIDRNGKINQTWKCKYLSVIYKNYYLGQQGYEEKLWGLYTLTDKPVWEKKEAIHHDIITTPQETIITFIKECHEYKGRLVDFDIIVEYDLKGKELQRWSTWENLKSIQIHHRKLELDLPKAWFLPELVKKKPKTPWGGNYDYYRLNSIQLLPKTKLGQKDARFQEGNWLISFRHGSMIFILDKDTKEIVWKAIANDIKGGSLPGGIQGQHAVQMLERDNDGKLLIFDNGRYRQQSRIIIVDPLTLNVEWEYTDKCFFTLSQGYVEELNDNGNEKFLITESEKGRAFIIDKSGKIEWEYLHPDTQNKINSPLHPESWGKRCWIYRMKKVRK